MRRTDADRVTRTWAPTDERAADAGLLVISPDEKTFDGQLCNLFMQGIALKLPVIRPLCKKFEAIISKLE